MNFLSYITNHRPVFFGLVAALGTACGGEELAMLDAESELMVLPEKGMDESCLDIMTAIDCYELVEGRAAAIEGQLVMTNGNHTTISHLAQQTYVLSAADQAAIDAAINAGQTLVAFGTQLAYKQATFGTSNSELTSAVRISTGYAKTVRRGRWESLLEADGGNVNTGWEKEEFCSTLPASWNAAAFRMRYGGLARATAEGHFAAYAAAFVGIQPPTAPLWWERPQICVF